MSTITNETIIAKVVTFVGSVQGVGFRATARRIAVEFRVTGWVKNLDYGRVQLLIEGAGVEIDGFLSALRRHWGDAITSEIVQPYPASGRYRGFSVVM